jgi:hypothetical protein
VNRRVREWLQFEPEIKRPSWAQVLLAWKQQSAYWGAYELVYHGGPSSFADVVDSEHSFNEVMRQLPPGTKGVDFYLELKHPSSIESPRSCWTSFTGHHLRYSDWLHPISKRNPTHDLYQAIVVSRPPDSVLCRGQQIVVKFTDTYHKRAHEMLAAIGLAPRLHYCERVDGGQFMVVMDIVYAYKADIVNARLSPEVMKDVRDALDCLHAAGLVLGDLRKQNIILLKQIGTSRTSCGTEPVRRRKAMLVDFDWAGEELTAKYPLSMNTGDIEWAATAAPGQPLMKEHDEYMFDRL